MVDEITDFLKKVQDQGVPVPDKAEDALRRAIASQNGFATDALRDAFLQKYLDGMKSIVQPQSVDRGTGAPVTEGATPSSLVGDMTKLIGRLENPQSIIEDLNLPFKIDVAVNVMRGGARFVAQNYDQDELDEFPALELLRVYDRIVPRGFERGPKGSLIPVPNDDWPSRFSDAIDACDDSDDDKAAMRDILESTGRMIALKSSGVWAELGSNRDDTLGNPYPPFAFNSGYDVDGVDRKEAESLGLIDPGEKAERADVDFETLFSMAE